MRFTYRISCILKWNINFLESNYNFSYLRLSYLSDNMNMLNGEIENNNNDNENNEELNDDFFDNFYN